MLSISSTPAWSAAYPGASIGLLQVENVDNTAPAPALEERKHAVQAALLQRYAGYDRPRLLELDLLRAYKTYYRKFGNTYHVQLQLESILFKSKTLPTVNPLVDAGFTAEIETLILTAAHDLDRLVPPLRIDVAAGDEQFTQMGGALKTVKPLDILMADATGVVCTILYGQDQVSPVTPATRRALYVAYAPPGVPAAAVAAHLEAIRANILLFAPLAAFPEQRVITAPPEA